MPDIKYSIFGKRLALVAALACLLTGCAQTTDWLQGKRPTETAAPVILGAPDAETYLGELRALAAGDPATQAEIFADADAAATLTPGSSSQLRLGLILATPGHAQANPERAQQLLREALAEPLLLTPAEIALATIHLNSAEQLIIAQTETRRLRASGSRAARTQEQATSQRLATVEAENRRLRRELEDAENKLEAITTIERSIRERE